MNIEDWGYDRVKVGAGAFNGNIHEGYGIVVCDCGNRMNVHEYAVSWCSRCGWACRWNGKKIVVHQNVESCLPWVVK